MRSSIAAKHIFVTRLNRELSRASRGSLETFEHGATRPHDCGAQVEPPRCIVQGGDATESCTRTRTHTHEYARTQMRERATLCQSRCASVGGPDLSVPSSSTRRIFTYTRACTYVSPPTPLPRRAQYICTRYVRQIRVSNSSLRRIVVSPVRRPALIFSGSTDCEIASING